MATIQKLETCLWFDNQAKEAAEFYVSIFKNSKIRVRVIVKNTILQVKLLIRQLLRLLLQEIKNREEK